MNQKISSRKILLVDAGNSRLKWMLVSDEKWPEKAVVHAIPNENLVSDLQADWSGLTNTGQKPEQIWLANTAGKKGAEIVQNTAQNLWQLPVQIAKTQAQGFGVKNAYEQFSQFGVDRWLVLIAARELVQQETRQLVCVISCGTAITVDVLDLSGIHLGGAIFPGFRLSNAEFQKRFAHLFAAQKLEEKKEKQEEKSEKLSFLGTSTQACIQIGQQNSLMQFLQKTNRQFCVDTENGSEKMQWLVAGGDAQKLVSLMQKEANFPAVMRIETNLVFQGLFRVAKADTSE